MSKNTRWALALIGAVIIIVAAVVIGTSKDDTDAVQQPATQPTAATGSTTTAPVTDSTGATGRGEPGTDDGAGSGGASPNDSGSGSGGASPGDVGEESGGARAPAGVVSPVLSDAKIRMVTVTKGQAVTIRGVSESDGEMHVHGYDKEVPLRSGVIARVKFKARIDGEFPIEFHLPSGEVKVGILRVNP